MAWNLEQYFNGTEISATRYADLIKALLEHDMVRCPEYAKTLEGDDIVARRIHWECFRHCNRSVPPWNGQGIYMYGHSKSKRDIRVMYIGMTAGTLNKRLVGRYFKCTDAMPKKGVATVRQFVIASIIHEHDMDYFKEKYSECLDNEGMQLRVGHAEHFEDVIDEVWFALFPCDKKSDVKKMEKSLIKQAKEYNRSEGITYKKFLLNA